MATVVLQPQPGLSTTDKILLFIERSPEGVTVKEITQKLNRSVSMVQRCLKLLLAERQIYTRLSDNGMQLIYYPGSIS